MTELLTNSKDVIIATDVSSIIVWILIENYY